MRHQRRFISIVLIGAFAGAAGFAAADDSNVFKADLSNPDLALAVNAFEQACLPFVLHKTEMTQALDRQHTADILESRNFELISSEVKSERVLVGELPRPRWKPGTLSTKGQFTVFNGFSNQVVQSTQTIVSKERLSFRVHILSEYNTINRELATYTLRSEDRLTANLLFNYATQNHPGKSCEIKLDRPKLDTASFAADFIDKDADWTPENNGWSQCITEGEDQFKFTVSQTPQALAISMIRNDFYAPNICGSQG